MLFRENAVMQNNGIKLSPNITLLSENNSVTSLSNAIGDVPKVIIRYSALACDLCLEEELKQISNYILKIGAENVLVFTSNENIRSLTVRKRKFPFNLKTYIIEDISIPFDEKNNNLFVFVLDKDFFVKDFFIPEKTLHSLSEYYYKTIQNKYWQ